MPLHSICFYFFFVLLLKNSRTNYSRFLIFYGKLVFLIKKIILIVNKMQKFHGFKISKTVFFVFISLMENMPHFVCYKSIYTRLYHFMYETWESLLHQTKVHIFSKKILKPNILSSNLQRMIFFFIYKIPVIKLCNSIVFDFVCKNIAIVFNSNTMHPVLFIYESIYHAVYTV